MLDGAQGVEPCGIREAAEFLAFQLSNAMFRGNRPARGRDQIVNEAGDGGALSFVPVDLRVTPCPDVEMNIAVAEMAETARRDPGKGALDFAGGGNEEVRHALDSHRHVVGKRRALGALGFVASTRTCQAWLPISGDRDPRTCLTTSCRQSSGTNSKPSMLSVCDSRKRSRSSARSGVCTPTQPTARAAIAGTSRSATAVITPRVPSAPISNWSRL